MVPFSAESTPSRGRVCLFALNGSYTHTSLALRCLRPPLEAAGFEVILLERNLRDRDDHILKALAETDADVVGFSAYIWNIGQMFSLAADLKTVCPRKKIIFGGPEVSYHTERFDHCAFIDAIVCGEGEAALPALCGALLAGKTYSRVTHGLPHSRTMADEGILYRKEEFDRGIIPKGALLYYESARGCPYHCAYCLSSVADGMRMKSPEQVRKDLIAFEELAADCKIIKFVDRTFNCNPARANAIWQELLNPRYTKHYHFEICASLLNEESFAVLARFPKGKIQLECGLQSTHEPTLRAVSRHIDPQAVIKAVKRVHDLGNIHIHLDLIAGLPYEDYDRFARSFDEAYHACDLLQLGFLKLLHGTELREKAEEYGILYRKEAPYTVLSTKWLSFDSLNRLHALSETLERFRDSDKFADSLAYMLRRAPSPFRFFEGLTDYIAQVDGRDLQKIGQPDAYRLFYAYCRNAQAKNFQTAEFEAALHNDYNRSETRRLPNLFTHPPENA